MVFKSPKFVVYVDNRVLKILGLQTRTELSQEVS